MKAKRVTKKDAKAAPERIKDITGKKFGDLEVLGFSRRAVNEKNRYNGTTFWVCRCKCGKITETAGGNLSNGRSQSCQECGKRKARENVAKSVTTHSMSNTDIYRKWCYIKIVGACERWQSFENFYEDMGDVPEDTPYIRRKDDNVFGPENSYWSETKAGGGVGKYKNRDGEIVTLAEIGREYGFSRQRAHQKIATAEKHGIDIWDYLEGKIKLIGRRGKETEIVRVAQ